MKHPLWIVNSGLLVLMIIALSLLYLLHYQIPNAATIASHGGTVVRHEESVHIDIKKIYENDLFGTYHREEVPFFASTYIPPMPEPPVPHETPEVVEVTPHFLDPLNISVKGIVVLNNSDTPNSAIIQNRSSGQDYHYSVGDMIEDARLVRIYPHKIVLLRTNGQQEILYINEDDARNDSSYIGIRDWDKVIEKIDDSTYTLDPKEFAKRITSLAEFIDVMGLVTAYKKGVSIGCRLGKSSDVSLREMLLLKTGDIIVAINGISTATTIDRLSIYNMLIALHEHDTISIDIVRKDVSFTLTIILQDRAKKRSENGEATSQVMQRAVSTLDNKQFAPTLRELEKLERSNMMKLGNTIGSGEK